MSTMMRINGEAFRSSSAPNARLLDVLRNECDLKGTKEGCGEGECGACAVLVNGKLVNSCLVPLGQMEQAEITTVEGLPEDSALAQAFVQCGATQCGICTPGMMLAATALLAEHANPTLEEIRWGLSGNLCRCTGYGRIYAAIAQAAGGSADV
ncbi:(2Fe-2S)-binding protein [Acidithiobacillus sp.]|jgi:aerobic-type carbon monoxide dehydrogenase small subunit (CoxS/CutS family)|uniref:(2Fe-2S)-binding protein n=1 Tax=Acidithiobacillus sp. TaxID=1872118 RepID=UPI0025C59893|nr:(2Fe-2S)-binding protein [Acidithiobacillus sp.]MCK9188801.1 (2Fe-2S)-binding protein [Acidithiobacillus sp.]MCK9359657.1 (2Fe-2S)-binding protein [Acidithiobacillus sp.]